MQCATNYQYGESSITFIDSISISYNNIVKANLHYKIIVYDN
jgi:hypothetical protein